MLAIPKRIEYLIKRSKIDYRTVRAERRRSNRGWSAVFRLWVIFHKRNAPRCGERKLRGGLG